MNASSEQPTSPEGVDRRALLTKAAAAGAVTWSVPLVVSTKVSAVDACTPVCPPPENQSPQAGPFVIRRECDGATRRYYLDAPPQFPSVIGCPCGNPQQFVEYTFIGPPSTTEVFSQNGTGSVDFDATLEFRIFCPSDPTVFRTCTTTGFFLFFDGDQTCTDTTINVPNSTSAPCGAIEC